MLGLVFLALYGLYVGLGLLTIWSGVLVLLQKPWQRGAVRRPAILRRLGATLLLGGGTAILRSVMFGFEQAFSVPTLQPVPSPTQLWGWGGAALLLGGLALLIWASLQKTDVYRPSDY